VEGVCESVKDYCGSFCCLSVFAEGDCVADDEDRILEIEGWPLIP
jgi:hypothetical protein